MPTHSKISAGFDAGNIARNDGLKSYLSSAGLGDKIEFVEQYADYDRGKGQAVTESILAKDKAYDFIVANNDDWHDDVADGPVTATVTFAGKAPVRVQQPAWAVVAPPDLAWSWANSPRTTLVKEYAPGLSRTVPLSVKVP